MNYNRCFIYVSFVRIGCRCELKFVVFDMKIIMYCGYRIVIYRYCRWIYILVYVYNLWFNKVLRMKFVVLKKCF